MNKEWKKFSLENVCKRLSEKEMKMHRGGYDNGGYGGYGGYQIDGNWGITCQPGEKVKWCECLLHVGTWFQCESANIGSSACKWSLYSCMIVGTYN